MRVWLRGGGCGFNVSPSPGGQVVENQKPGDLLDISLQVLIAHGLFSTRTSYEHSLKYTPSKEQPRPRVHTQLRITL